MGKVDGTSARHADDSEAITQLAGPWHLVTIEQPGDDGATTAMKTTGLLVITRDGHMAVQVRNLESPVVDNPYSSGGYEASYGTIALDTAGNSFVYHVEGALVQALAGQDLPRRFQFVEDRLILSSTRDDEHWRVIWRRG